MTESRKTLNFESLEDRLETCVVAASSPKMDVRVGILKRQRY